MSRDGVSATGWIARAAVAATLSLAVVACGDSPGDEAGSASSPPSSGGAGPESSASTTVLAAPGTPFPEGVYQGGSLTPDDWTAQGLPADNQSDVDYHVVTFTGGTVYDIAAHDDGSRETGSQWTYTVTGDNQITLSDLGDTSRTLTMEWDLSEDNQLTFTMAPDQGEPEDRVLWTSHPFAKVG